MHSRIVPHMDPGTPNICLFSNVRPNIWRRNEHPPECSPVGTTLSYYHYSVKDFKAPTSDQFNSIKDNLLNGTSPKLVYCGYGHGRTGTVVSAYMIWNSQTLSHDDYRHNLVEEEVQFDALDKLQGISDSDSDSDSNSNSESESDSSVSTSFCSSGPHTETTHTSEHQARTTLRESFNSIQSLQCCLLKYS